MTLIRLILFTLLIPGLVICYIPYAIYNDKETLDIGLLKFVGLPLIIAGIVFYVWSALSFLIKGQGTPAIWFTKHLKFLIGEEPLKMVSSGLYRISRNPMYVGIESIAIGEALLFESKLILFYSLFLTLFFYLTVVFVEEPHLRKKHGKDYEEYLQRTSRWLGLTKRTKTTLDNRP